MAAHPNVVVEDPNAIRIRLNPVAWNLNQKRGKTASRQANAIRGDDCGLLNVFAVVQLTLLGGAVVKPWAMTGI